MLYKLLSQRATDDVVQVIALAGEGPMALKIRALGVPVHALGLPRGAAALRGLPALAARIRRARPDLVQCWMYHANLMGGLAARLGTAAPVLWGLRQTDLDPVLSKPGTVRVAKLGARFSSHLPRRILCVSDSARRVHAAMGYDETRMVVIPNGFDLDHFRPNPAARAALRAELGLDPSTVLVGLIARFDPQKDVGGFVAAARRIVEDHEGTHFVLCGQGMDHRNSDLAAMISAKGLDDRLHLLGRRDDMAAVTAALDIVVSASAFGEGFSNTLGEALCCAVPVVATDVGESRRIVGAEGRVVAPRDPKALAAAVGELVAVGEAGRAALGAAGRARMARDYALPAVATRYHTLYEEVLTAG